MQRAIIVIGQSECRPRLQTYNEQEMHISIEGAVSKVRGIDLTTKSNLSMEK